MPLTLPICSSSVPPCIGVQCLAGAPRAPFLRAAGLDHTMDAKIINWWNSCQATWYCGISGVFFVREFFLKLAIFART
jgi:hypothetical protein